MSIRKTGIVLFLFILWVASLATAEVADSAANGFTVKITATIQSPPETVYERFLQVGNWWSSEHTYSRDAKNLTLDPKPMGCWCEKLPNGGAVRHMEVLALIPGKYIVLSGGLGPLQSVAAAGTMKITLTPADGGTKVDVVYSVTGYLPAGMNTWAAPVDGVLSTQIARLKSYVETGNPALKR